MSEKEEKQARYIEKLTQAQIKLIQENETLKSRIKKLENEKHTEKSN